MQAKTTVHPRTNRVGKIKIFGDCTFGKGPQYEALFLFNKNRQPLDVR